MTKTHYIVLALFIVALIVYGCFGVYQKYQDLVQQISTISSTIYGDPNNTSTVGLLPVVANHQRTIYGDGSGNVGSGIVPLLTTPEVGIDARLKKIQGDIDALISNGKG